MKYLATALVLGLSLTGLSYGAVDVGVSAGINVSGDKDVNFNLFYENLSPHGKWMEVKDYGWVWQPTVAIETASWRPYMNEGHWVYTDYGWYWVSDYEWGWAPFHYGRWTTVEDKWVWVPGETWGPAWVTWRESDRYFGWAPLPPAVVFQPGVGLEFHGKHVEANFDFGLNANFFTFVPADHFLAENVATVAVAPAQVTTIYRETKVVNNSFSVNDNRIVDRGIDPQRVSQVTKQQVKTVNVTASNTPVSGREALKDNTLHAFKPEVKKEGAKTPKDFQQNTDKSGASAKSKAEHPLNTSVENRNANTNTNNAQSTKAAPQQNPGVKKAEDLNANKAQTPAQKPEATEPKAQERQERQELKKNEPATKAPELNQRRTEANPPKELNRPEAAPRTDLNAPKAQEPANRASEASKPRESSATDVNELKSERPVNTSVEPRRSERAEPSSRAPSVAPRSPEAARPSEPQLRADERREAAPRASEEMKQRTDTSATKNDTEVKKSNPIR